MKIRAAKPEDAQAIHELHCRSLRELWPSHYSERQIEGWIAGRTPEGCLPGISKGEMFVAVEASRVVGFGHAVPGVIKAIYVAPEAVGRGVGAALLERAIDVASVDGEQVVRLQSTLNAEGFYRRFGFEVVRERSVEKGEISLPVVVMQLPVQTN